MTQNIDLETRADHNSQSKPEWYQITLYRMLWAMFWMAIWFSSIAFFMRGRIPSGPFYFPLLLCLLTAVFLCPFIAVGVLLNQLSRILGVGILITLAFLSLAFLAIIVIGIRPR